MWTRSDLKFRAKNTLRGNYWLALAACLIVSVITTVCTNLVSAISGTGSVVNEITAATEPYTFADAMASLGSVSLGGILSILVVIFLQAPLSVGLAKYFVRLAEGENDLGNIWSGFKGNYGNVVFTMFKKDLFVFLWSLLLVIPGIVKSYQYAMVEYILADDPSISSHDALIQSREMMYGHKLNFFLLQLSFIGWFFLGMAVCGVGALFVMPYYSATIAHFYNEIKPSNRVITAEVI